jgi:hypothetical protein
LNHQSRPSEGEVPREKRASTEVAPPDPQPESGEDPAREKDAFTRIHSLNVACQMAGSCQTNLLKTRWIKAS